MTKLSILILLLNTFLFLEGKQYKGQGKAILHEDQTVRKVKEEAFTNAKKDAIEQFGVLINYTTIHNKKSKTKDGKESFEEEFNEFISQGFESKVKKISENYTKKEVGDHTEYICDATFDIDEESFKKFIEHKRELQKNKQLSELKESNKKQEELLRQKQFEREQKQREFEIEKAKIERDRIENEAILKAKNAEEIVRLKKEKEDRIRKKQEEEEREREEEERWERIKYGLEKRSFWIPKYTYMYSVNPNMNFIGLGFLTSNNDWGLSWEILYGILNKINAQYNTPFDKKYDISYRPTILYGNFIISKNIFNTKSVLSLIGVGFGGSYNTVPSETITLDGNSVYINLDEKTIFYFALKKDFVFFNRLNISTSFNVDTEGKWNLLFGAGFCFLINY